jgi:hypothetical protein
MIPGKTKVMFSPAMLVHVFGPPSYHEDIKGTSAVFNFEDSNLDGFKIFDRYQCREFLDPKKLKLKYPPYSHKGKSLDLPTIEEFWKLQNKAEFWVEYTAYADIQNFLKWVEDLLQKGESAKERVEKKFGEIPYNNLFDKKYEISSDYAAFRYNKFNWD